ncbi:MAG: M18 family aminopeptidase, partial [Thiohalomonadales bacterium]
LKKSPTPFHAVDHINDVLTTAGYVRLYESDPWELRAGGSYFVIRNDSSLIAFTMGAAVAMETGLRIVAAHTDSPCLKVKPNPEIVKDSYFQLGVEVYGGALLNPWFDRDLSLAGRVSYLTSDESIKHALIDFGYALATIPSLAIHLDRDANSKHSIDKQKDLSPVIMHISDSDVKTFREMLYDYMINEDPASKIVEVLDYDLCFYDTQAPAVIGVNQDFIAGARLDNLLSCYVGLMSFIESGEDISCILVCNDHEEIGSVSAAGAQGTFLRSVLERIAGTSQDFARIMDRSILISADNAHGVHPNFPEKHDVNHGPILNEGPVIKVNGNHRYATTSETSALFRRICHKVEVPVQSYVTRNDMACGSTLGPITSSILGVKTVDVGVPTFAMHSIRELAGRYDAYYLYKVLSEFYKN